MDLGLAGRSCRPRLGLELYLLLLGEGLSDPLVWLCGPPCVPLTRAPTEPFCAAELGGGGIGSFRPPVNLSEAVKVVFVLSWLILRGS